MNAAAASLGAATTLATAAVMLLWAPVLSSAFALPKLVLLSLGGVAGALAVCAGAPLELERSLARPLGFGLAVLTLCAALSQDPWLSFVGDYNTYACGLWAIALCSTAHVAAASLEPPWPRRLETLLCALAVLIGGYGVLQSAGLDPWLSKQLPFGRAVGTLGSPFGLGALLSALLPLLLRRARAGWAWKIATALAAAGLFATESRGAWLAAAAGAGLYMAAGDALSECNQRRRRQAFAVAALACALGLAAAGAKSARSWKESDSARVEIWKTAWESFREHPWLGSGPDTFEQSFRRLRSEQFVRISGVSHAMQAHAHNELLQALATTGLAGLGAYLLLLASLLAAARDAWSQSAHRDQAAALCATLLAIFVNMKFNPIATEIHLVAALAAALLCRLRPQTSKPRALGAAARATILAGALGGGFLGVRLYKADASFQEAKRAAAAGRRAEAFARYQRASALVPQELEYKMWLINLAGDLINETRSADERLRLLGLIDQAARESLRLRPFEINAHYIAGIVALMHAQLGLREQLGMSLFALDEAARLDPLYKSMQLSRLDAARFSGDPDRIESVRRAIERIDAIIRRR